MLKFKSEQKYKKVIIIVFFTLSTFLFIFGNCSARLFFNHKVHIAHKVFSS